MLLTCAPRLWFLFIVSTVDELDSEAAVTALNLNEHEVLGRHQRVLLEDEDSNQHAVKRFRSEAKVTSNIAMPLNQIGTSL